MGIIGKIKKCQQKKPKNVEKVSFKPTLSYLLFSFCFFRRLQTSSNTTPEMTTMIIAAKTPMMSIWLELTDLPTSSTLSAEVLCQCIYIIQLYT